MRILTMSEIRVVHGGDGDGDSTSFAGWFAEKWNSIWEKLEEAEKWFTAYEDLHKATTDGDVSPENACKSLGDLLELVPHKGDPTSADVYSGENAAELCLKGVKGIQDGLSNERQAEQDAGAQNTYNDQPSSDYFESENWLDNLLADYNQDVVDDHWGDDPTGTVEIEECHV